MSAFIAVLLADMYEYVYIDGITAVAKLVVYEEQRVVQWVATAGISVQSWWCAFTSWRWCFASTSIGGDYSGLAKEKVHV